MECAFEHRPEVDPNGTPAEAQANPAIDVRFVQDGSIPFAGDRDMFLLHLDAYSDVRAQVWGPVPYACADFDALVHILRLDGTEVAADDDSGSDKCPDLNPLTRASARAIPPGDYAVLVNEYEDNAPITAYLLFVTIESRCGNGRLESTEECELGTAHCGDNCRLLPVCGNGVIESGEQCDDGDSTPGDGCDELCRYEVTHRCTGVPSVCTRLETTCNDGIDDDADMRTDLNDSDCAFSSVVNACPAGQQMRVFTSKDTPITLDTGIAGTSFMRLAAGTGTVRHAAVKLSLSNPNPSDVEVALWSPDGIQVPLTQHHGAPGIGYVGTVFDDSCSTAIASGNTPFTGCFHPDGTLSDVDGTSAQGEWRLVGLDTQPGNHGSLVQWSLFMCTEP